MFTSIRYFREKIRKTLGQKERENQTHMENCWNFSFRTNIAVSSFWVKTILWDWNMQRLSKNYRKKTFFNLKKWRYHELGVSFHYDNLQLQPIKILDFIIVMSERCVDNLPEGLQLNLSCWSAKTAVEQYQRNNKAAPADNFTCRP